MRAAMLHVALALNCRRDLLVEFVPNRPPKRVSLGELVAETFTVLIGAAGEISGDARVERPVELVRHDGDPAPARLGDGASGGGVRKTWMAGTSPAMTNRIY